MATGHRKAPRRPRCASGVRSATEKPVALRHAIPLSKPLSEPSCKPPCRIPMPSEAPSTLRTHVRFKDKDDRTADRHRRPPDRLRNPRRVRARARWEHSPGLRRPRASPLSNPSVPTQRPVQPPRGSWIPPPTGFRANPKPGPRLGAARASRRTGGDLLSQEVALQVPSALRGLTALFGMGRGVSLSLCATGNFSRRCARWSLKTAQDLRVRNIRQALDPLVPVG